MSVISLAQALVQETESAIYERAIDVARTAKLPVTSWHPGDPTRSLYHLLSKTLANIEGVVVQYIAAGFLDHASGEWLRLLAQQVYGVEAKAESYATCTCRLTNNGGGVYTFDAGDLTVKKGNGVTYHNTTGGTLLGKSASATTLDLEFVADVAGSSGSANIGEINALVTAYLGVSVANTTAALGTDTEEDEPLRVRCRAKLGMLSPNGPDDAYNYVATSTVASVTRAKCVASTTYGNVTVYVASDAGPVSQSDVDTILDAVTKQATPLCVTPSVKSAVAKTVTVQYHLWLYQTVGETEANIKTAVATALAKMFSLRPIGGDVLTANGAGALYLSLISRTIEAVYPNHAYRVQLVSPTVDVSLASNEVAILSLSADSTVTLVDA